MLSSCPSSSRLLDAASFLGLLVGVLFLELAEQLQLTFLSDTLAVGCKHALLKHACGKDLEHLASFLHALLFSKNVILLIFLLVINVLIINVFGSVDILLVIASGKLGVSELLAVHPSLSELLHHFEELATVILEHVIGNSEDAALDSEAAAQAEEVVGVVVALSSSRSNGVALGIFVASTLLVELDVVFLLFVVVLRVVVVVIVFASSSNSSSS